MFIIRYQWVEVSRHLKPHFGGFSRDRGNETWPAASVWWMRLTDVERNVERSLSTSIRPSAPRKLDAACVTNDRAVGNYPSRPSFCSAHFGYMYKNEAWRDQGAHYIVNFSRAQSITVITSLHYCRSCRNRKFKFDSLSLKFYSIKICSLQLKQNQYKSGCIFSLVAEFKRYR